MDKHQNLMPENAKDEAIRLYNEGAEAWRKGERGRAISLYAHSAELDPDGPGAQALEMSQRIMDFYDKSQLNP